MISVTERITESRNGSTSVDRRLYSFSPLLGDLVEAPRPPVGVLPLPLDHPLRLQLPQQRIHRVRVDRDHPLRDLLDLLDQVVAVGRLGADQVQDEEREDVAAADLAAEDVGWAAATLAGRRPGLVESAAFAASSTASRSGLELLLVILRVYVPHRRRLPAKASASVVARTGSGVLRKVGKMKSSPDVRRMACGQTRGSMWRPGPKRSGSQARHSRRGWRLDKIERADNIDAVVALAMAVERASWEPEPVRLLGWV